MAAGLEDRVLDLGLNVLDTEATDLYIVALNSEPTSYAVATGATSALGKKAFGAGAAFGAPAAGSPNGRKVSSTNVTDGTIFTSGTAHWWAAVDTVSSRLLAHGSLSSDQVVSAGNSFTLSVFDIRIPGS